MSLSETINYKSDRVCSSIPVAGNEVHLLPSGLYRRCRSFNGSAICNMISDILPMGRGLYRRLGLSPDPEDSGRKCMEKFLLFQVNAFRQLADFILQVFGNAEFVTAPGFYPSQYFKLDFADSQFDARIIANELKHLGVH